jgi:hypothetical protein
MGGMRRPLGAATPMVSATASSAFPSDWRHFQILRATFSRRSTPPARESLPAARRHSSAHGQAEAKTIFALRALIFSGAPSFSSFSPIVPHVAMEPTSL